MIRYLLIAAALALNSLPLAFADDCNDKARKALGLPCPLAEKAAAALGLPDGDAARRAASAAVNPEVTGVRIWDEAAGKWVDATSASPACDCHATGECLCAPGTCACCEKGVPSYAEQYAKAAAGKDGTVIVGFFGTQGHCLDGALCGQAPGSPAIVVGAKRDGKLVEISRLPATASKADVQAAVRAATGRWETRQVCHGSYCTQERVWVTDTPAVGETPAELRTALLADLDGVLNSWVVGSDAKRRARAVRAVIETDADVIEKIRAKLQ